MTQLQRRSDGACETQDGFFAVKIRTVSGITDGNKWFEFKATMMGPVTRIEWPEHAPFALLPQEEAKVLVRSGYAIGITDQEMAEYNKGLASKTVAKAPVVAPKVEPPKAKPDPTPIWVKPAEPTANPTEPLPNTTPDVPTGTAPVTAAPIATAPITAPPVPTPVAQELKPITTP